jgi:hypothetical protein
MKKLLIVFAVVAAFLCLPVAPAFADYFSDMQPNNAYVHPWSDPVYWEGVAPNPMTGELEYFASTDPVPADYTVWYSAWLVLPTKCTIAAMPCNTRLALTAHAPDGKTMLSLTPRKAVRFWGKPFVGWEDRALYRANAKYWVIAWVYRLGTLAPGDYGGVATWTFRFPFLDFSYFEGATKPTLIPAGTTIYHYAFTVEEPTD